jgi:hypothetical protein
MGCVIKLQSLSLPTAFHKKRGKIRARKKVSSHVHLQDPGPPVPDEHLMTIPLLPVTSYDADKVAVYHTLALSHSNVPELLQTQDSSLADKAYD